MNEHHVKLLRCLECGQDLAIDSREGVGEKMQFAILGCTGCSSWYPVIDGVGVFFRRNVMGLYLTPYERQAIERMGRDVSELNGAGGDAGDLKQHRTAEKWQAHWEQYWAEGKWESHLKNCENSSEEGDVCSSHVFWNFIPLERELIQGASVFIACSGGGREAYHVARHSPSLLIINEINPYIYSTEKLLGELTDNLLLIRNDISYSPLKECVADICICDHALQHILDHKKAFSNLASAAKPGGRVAICVYSHENNAVMTKIVEPSKALLSRLPLSVVRFLALIAACIMYGIMHLVYRPIRCFLPNVYKHLPLGSLIGFWIKNSFHVIWSNCYDLMHAGISYHFRKDEVEGLARDNGLHVEKLVMVYDTLWSLIACKNDQKRAG